MDWKQIPLTEHMPEAAAVVSEAEIVIEFSPAARGWFRLTVFDDLRATDDDRRYFARATELEEEELQAIGSGATPEAAATACLREAGVTLRRARGA